jgi:autotransporter-associated beta strand protein
VLLKYDVQPTAAYVTGPETIPGTISGSGPIQVNAGAVTFAGANTFTGTINLTGGELIAGSVETVGISGPLGQGGIISLNGGTLGWNPANAFDYSSRFNTSANQAYNLDTGGSSPTLATGLTSSGGSLTKLGGGTLTLAGANTYTGPTTVSVGALLIQGTMTGTGNITVSDGATLGVVENGSQIRPGTLTVGTSTGAILEFNNVTNHLTATLAPTNLASAGTVTINVNSGRFFSIGETFPLLSWTSGAAPAVSLGFLAGAGGHLTTNANEIDLVIDDPPYIWTAAADTTWNTTSIDWTRSGSPVTWVNGHFALLDDTAANGNVTLSGTITPTNATINNSALAYAITSSGGNVIGGGGSLTKNGNGTLTLPGGANTYTGVTTVGGGVLAANVLANGGVASDIGAASSAATNIVLNGGTLQYTGPGVSIDRLFAVGPIGGTIDSEGTAALVFNNSGSVVMSGNGPRTLTLTGLNGFGDTIASAIVNHPAGTSLRKDGVGTWTLTGTNTYAGGTAILNGTLQVGAGGLSGTLGNGNISTASGTGIDFNRTGTLTVPGAITGNGGLTNDGTGTVILANNSTYSGGTTINAGTLQVGNGGGSGSLNTAGLILNNSLLVFNTAGSFSYGSGAAAGVISGTGNVIVQGGGFIKAIGNNTYSGWTRIDANTTFQPVEGQDGGIATSVITNNGTLRLVRQDALITYPGPIVGTGRVQIGANNVNVGVITLTGTNTYTGGTFIGDNQLVLGDGGNPGFGAIAGNVQFVNNFTISQDNPRTLTFNRPDDFTFGGTITTNFASPQVNQGIVQQNGTGRLTLTGNNTYGSGTVINAGILQVGAGGGTGSLGTGPVTDNSLLVFNRTGTLAVGTLSGGGSLTNLGTGTVTLSGASSIGGNVDLLAGTFGAAPVGAVGSLSVGGNLTIASGVTLLAGVNRSLSPSNSVYNVTGLINYTSGGTLKLINGGPLLQVGDKFTIFSQPVTNLTLVTPGVTVQNDLALDGSVTVATAAPAPTLTVTVSGVGSTTLNLSWPAIWTGGVHLQVQTNTLAKGLSSNWVTIAGTDASNTFSTPINKGTNVSVFYRLIAP